MAVSHFIEVTNSFVTGFKAMFHASHRETPLILSVIILIIFSLRFE